MAVILQKQRVIVRFDNTIFASTTGASAESGEVSLSVCSGDLFLIRLARLEQTATFADACAGIIQPISGRVYFLGRNWPELPTDQANALRGRIGRVFRTGNWINHLSLMENILLSQLHHTRRFHNRRPAARCLCASIFGSTPADSFRRANFRNLR
jgi:phospholipid/cholesterol/gamma-HCH transport system ATP-binding protein